MDGLHQQASKASLIAWGLITAFFIVMEVASGVAGILTSLLPVAFPSNIPFYIQCGTSITALILSLCETGLLVTITRWLKRKTYERNNINGLPVNEEVRDFSVCHLLQLYFGFIGINTAVLIIVWSLTIVYNYNHSWLEGSLWPFIAIEVGLGIIAPILFLFSLLPILRIIRYVSVKKIETRRLLLWFLPCLGYEQGSREAYWVIEDSFYFKIDKKCCGNFSTVLICTITSLTFLLSWAYFISDAIISQNGIPNCLYLTEQDKESIYCFRIHPTENNMYINCTENSSYTDRLFCFEFKQLAKSSNPIQSFVISVVLYYITTLCISFIFNIMKKLMEHAKSCLWPTLLTFTGFSVFLVGAVSFIEAYYQYTKLNILVVFQLIVISLNIVVVSVLSCNGHPMDDQHFYHRNINGSVNQSPISFQPHVSETQSVQIPQEVEVVRHDLPPPSPSPTPPIPATEADSNNEADTEQIPHQPPSLTDTAESMSNNRSGTPTAIMIEGSPHSNISPTAQYYQAQRPTLPGIPGQIGKVPKLVSYYTFPRQPRRMHMAPRVYYRAPRLSIPIPVSDPNDRNVESGFGMPGRKVTIV